MRLALLTKHYSDILKCEEALLFNLLCNCPVHRVRYRLFSDCCLIGVLSFSTGLLISSAKSVLLPVFITSVRGTTSNYLFDVQSIGYSCFFTFLHLWPFLESTLLPKYILNPSTFIYPHYKPLVQAKPDAPELIDTFFPCEQVSRLPSCPLKISA